MNFGKEVIDKLERIYSAPKVVIKVNGKLTTIINLERGLLQGDPCSGTLFEIYLDPLFRYVEERMCGVQVSENVFLKSAAFLDDGNFITGSENDVKTVCKGLHWYEQRFHVKIHRQKSSVLPLNKSANYDDIERNCWLPFAEKARVLGLTFEKVLNTKKNWEEKVNK